MSEVVDRLRAFVVRMAKEHGVGVGHIEWPLGFSVVDARPDFRYDMTPRRSTTFAVTGGDGVHFGELPNRVAVMTSPCSFWQNLIVGETVEEFLRLGCHGGFRWLEDVPDDWNRACSRYREPSTEPYGAEVIEGLRAEFSLRPVSDVSTHLHGLQVTLWPRLRPYGPAGKVRRPTSGGRPT